MPSKKQELDPTLVPTLKAPSRGGEIGTSGLIRYGDDISDEWLLAMQGTRGVRVIREMKDNDPTIGSSLYVMDSTVRKVPWRMDRAPDHALAEEAAVFAEQCMADMSHTWQDFLGEAMSQVPFGWVLFEKVFKIRNGRSAKGTPSSKQSDGKLGIRKLAIRAQETCDGWAFDDEGGISGMYQVAAPLFKRVLIPIESAVLFRPQLAKNNPMGRSLLRNAYRPWFFLKRLEELEAIGIEREYVGLGKQELPLSYFDSNAPADKRAAILAYAKQLQQLRRNESDGMVCPTELDKDGKPTGFKFSLVTSGGARAMDITAAITRHRQSIGQVLLTTFIFLGMDKVGAQALSMDLTDLFAASLGSILDSIEETFDRFVMAELMELNGYPPEAWPRWRHGDVEKADITPLANALAKLVDSGLLTPDGTLEDYLRTEARLPEKDESEEEPERGADLDGDVDTSDVEELTTAIEKLMAAGDTEMANQLRDALAMKLGLPSPSPLQPAA